MQFSPYSKFDFFPLTLFLTFKTPGQLSFWVTEPVYGNKELSCLPYKNQNPGKFKFAIWWEFTHESFFYRATFNKMRMLL